MEKFQEDEKKNFYSSIEKTNPLARPSKILENRNTEIGTLVKEDGSYTTSPEDTLTHLADELLGKEVENKNQNTGKNENPNKTYNSKQDEKYIDNIINQPRLRKAVRELKKKKAPGPDELYNEMIIESLDIIIEPLIDLLKACLMSGHTPKIWQKAGSAIIAKPGKEDYTKARSYRIITLSSNLLKVTETLMLWHLKDDLKLEDGLCNTQYGFKKGSSTDAALLKLIDNIQEALKVGHHALGVFLDIEGAFDNLPHDSIKRALNQTKAKGMVSDWIVNMIKNRHIILKSSGATISRHAPKGCPQGGVLSPFLWNLVLDSLLKKFKKYENAQAFADDVSVLNTGPVPYGLFRKASEMIKDIIRWCKVNGLKISAMKTKILYWSRSRENHPTSIKIEGINIPLSRSVKYLGVIIDDKLNWNDHINEIIIKCKKTFFAVKRAIGKKWGLSPKQMMWIYKTIIIPKISYGQ